MSDVNVLDEVRIHIDRAPFTSPNPTTGEALYHLADLGEDYDLFREVEGDREDERVPRDHTEIHLREDDHFYSEKIVIIVVEGKPHRWPEGEITYAEVVTLEVPDYAKHPEITYSVKYKNGPPPRREGPLSPGGKVRVKEGMIFSVSETGQS